MNTGSPDSTDVADLRKYLKEFLMDPFVIDLPWPLRALLVYGVILPRRPAESAKAYKKIWTENGSPLIHYCSELAKGLNEKFEEPVELAMAYGNPSYRDAVRNLIEKGVDEICLLPMFPHYALATTAACTAVVKRELGRQKSVAKLRVVPPFYLEPTLVESLAESLNGVEEHILFSYHGLPERHLKKTDPSGNHCLTQSDCCNTPSSAHATCYRHQCFETTKAVVKIAGITEGDYTLSFQSRLGRDPWLQPYTDQTLQEFPKKGIKNLAVVCPAFFCDCLETLEEIEMQGRKIFMDAGGETFRMIPCLNDTPAAFQCLKTLMTDAVNWPPAK